MKLWKLSNLVFVMVIAFLGLAIVWISVAELDEVIRAEAVVEPKGQVQTVQSRYAGIIETLNVVVGQRVGSGEALIAVRSTDADAALAKNTLALQSLSAEIDRLKAEVRLNNEITWSADVSEVDRLEQEQLFVTRRSRLRQQNDLLADELKGLLNREVELKSIAANAETMLGLKAEEVKIFEPLVAEGIEPSIRLLMANQELQRFQSELDQSRIRLKGVVIEISRLKKKQDELRIDYQAEAQEILVKKETEARQLAAESKALKDRVESTILKAPIAGTITKVHPPGIGFVVSPAEPLIEMVPATQQISVKAKVRPQDIGELFVGQEARIGLSAYDFTVYGVLTGSIKDIAQNTEQGDSGEVYYEVSIETENLSLSKSDVIPKVIPGMIASVDIAGGKRSVLDYLLKPVRETASRALSEK